MRVPVLLPTIFNYPLTYLVEPEDFPEPGEYVKVMFRNKEQVGVTWNFEQKINKKVKFKKIIKRVGIPKMNDDMIKFINWFSKYNMVPLGMALKMTFLSKNVVDNTFVKEFEKFKIKKNITNPILNSEQKKSLDLLKKAGNKYQVTVLEGVTGSGKTLVYFERIKEVILSGSQSLILLPEIALTDQFKMKFKLFFGVEPAIWHSGTSKKNKKIIWRGVIENNIKVVLGARSALFLPFKKLGLIIVDEEHDASYKQDEGIIYNARDMAITRASIENIPIHLITSIPSIETYHNMINKKYNSTFISKRYKKASLPSFKIINLNNSLMKKGNWIADKTINEVKKFLNKGDQVLFFLNRRGYAPFISCKNCKLKFQCPNCSINLNFHKNINKLLCHYCGYKTLLKRNCQNNEECEFFMLGPGVERIFYEVKKIFPKRKIEIFSSDTLSKNSSAKNFISRVENKKIDILIGTQLISKGFHFSKLNCIVVVDLDLSSHGYDLRSSEKNIQLYHQLSGRAGRTGRKATVYFQTYTPEDEILLNISKNNPHEFLKKEICLRKNKKLPPFFRLISLIISGKNEKLANKFSQTLKLELLKIKNIDVLGPVNAPIFKLKNYFRCRILIRYPKNIFIQKKLSPLIQQFKIPPKIKLAVDVDPINFS